MLPTRSHLEMIRKSLRLMVEQILGGEATEAQQVPFHHLHFVLGFIGMANAQAHCRRSRFRILAAVLALCYCERHAVLKCAGRCLAYHE